MSGGTLGLLALALGGGTLVTLLVLNSWEDVVKNPDVALETIANTIESNPNFAITTLRAGGNQLLSTDGFLAPLSLAKDIILDLVKADNVDLDWVFSPTALELEEDAAIPEFKRKQTAVQWGTLMNGVADNLSLGPAAVASVVAALRSVASRIKTAGADAIYFWYWTQPPEIKALLDPNKDIYIAEIYIDLLINISPQLDYWKDPRPNKTIVQQFNQMTLTERKIRSEIINYNESKITAKLICLNGWGTNINYSMSPAPACVDLNAANNLSLLMANIQSIENGTYPPMM
jgi:hypothetical protein